jgi:RHS repeat-associated protein
MTLTANFNKSAIAALVLLCASVTLKGQDSTPMPNFELKTNETGATKNYVARDYISLQPGFSYTATQSADGSDKKTFSAKVDNCILFPPTDNTYLLADGTYSSTIPAGQTGTVVGSIPGQFAVSPTGAATYSMPIEVPAGINGMQPNISLVYNSQAGNGIAGWGWNIGGISMITRVAKTVYHDGKSSPIIWDSSSPLSLDGNRLLEYQRWGIDSVEYKSESESFARIVGYEIASYGPKYFKVYTKEGSVLKYGSNFYSNFPLYAVQNAPTTNSEFLNGNNLGWGLVSVSDLNGNTLSYQYIAEWGGSYGKWYAWSHRIDRITYGSNTRLGNTPFAEVIFNYEDRPDEIIGYIDGFKNSQKKRLSSIVVKSNASEFCHYNLLYKTCNLGKSRLDEVVYGVGDHNYPPTKINWGSNTFNVVSSAINDAFADDFTDVGNGSKTWFSGDIDADGKFELISMFDYKFLGKASKMYQIFDASLNESGAVSFKQTGSYINDRVTNYSDISFFTGESYHRRAGLPNTCFFTGGDSPNLMMPYLVKFYNGYSRLEFWDVLSSSYWYKELNSTASDIPPFCFGDLDNDGNDDVAFVEQSKYNNGYPLCIFFGQTCVNSFGNVTMPSSGSPSNQVSISLNLPAKPIKIQISDFDNDGLKDLLVVTEMGDCFYENMGCVTDASGKTNITLQAKSQGIIYNENSSFFESGDFNGDGLIDFLVNKKCTSEWFLSLNQGNWNYSNNLISNLKTEEDSFTTLNDDNDQCIVVDFNNDGMSDIIVMDTDFDKNPNPRLPAPVFVESSVSWYVSDGSGFVLHKSLISDEESYSWIKRNVIGDFDGDGRVDLLSYSADLYSNPIKDENFHLHRSPNLAYKEGLVNSVTDGFGSEFKIEYKPLSDENVYQFEYPGYAKKNIRNFQMPLYVTSKTTEEVGVGKTVPTQYAYKNAILHLQGKGFLGFKSVVTKNLSTNIQTENKYELNEDFYLLKPFSSEIRYGDYGTLSFTEYYYSVIARGDYGYWLRSDGSEETDKKDDIVTTTWINDYNTNGEPCIIGKDNRFVSSTGSGTYESQHIVYHDRFNKPIKVTTERSDGIDKETIVSEFKYDGLGNLIKESQFVGDRNEITIEYPSTNIDVFGNPHLIITTANGKERKNSISYSPCGRFVTHSQNSTFGTSTSYVYDYSKGVLLSKKDTLGTETFVYDAFNQVVSGEKYDKTKEVSVIQWAKNESAKPNGALYYTHVEASGETPTVTWYDKYQNVLRTDTKGFGDKDVSVSVEYDQLGRVYRITEPYDLANPGKTSYAKTYGYDYLGRVDKTTTPFGVTKFEFLPLVTTVTSPDGVVKTKINESRQIIEKVTNNKMVSYTYWPSGQVKTATPQGGAAVKTWYDQQGNRIKMIDPDAGVVLSEYNGFGQVLWSERRKTENGTVLMRTDYDFDSKAILTEKRVKDDKNNVETTTYKYDGLYRPTEIEIAGQHKQSIEYDKLGRVSKTIEEICGQKSFPTETVYDAFGRVAKEVYPSGYFTVNTYDQYGYLIKVSDGKDRAIWEAVEANTKGQWLKTKQGGRALDFEYDNRGFNAAILSNGIIDMTYSYNTQGNLINRFDRISDHWEEFGYDNLNRLTDSYIWLSNEFLLLKENHYKYNDNTGNLEQKSDLNDLVMNYGEDNKPLHAITSIAGNPDAISDVEQTITYNMYRKLSSVTEDNNAHFLTYGVDQQRKRGVFTQNNKTTLTRYYLGNYEEEVKPDGSTRKIHYISGGNGLSAIYVQNGGADSLYYCYSDYQGNLLAVTDDAGKVLQRLAYDPWGARRNPKDWSQPDTRTNHLFARGYTMHEHLDQFGLINMNGRVYDPLLASFLNPDPLIGDPGNWSSYNRFAYCYNNPLIYSDPSGEIPLFLLAAFAYTAGAGLRGYGDYTQNGNLVSSGNTLMLMGGIGMGYAGGMAVAVGGCGFGLAGSTVINGFLGGFSSAMNGGSFEKGFLYATLPSLAFAGLHAIGEIPYKRYSNIRNYDHQVIRKVADLVPVLKTPAISVPGLPMGYIRRYTESSVVPGSPIVHARLVAPRTVGGRMNIPSPISLSDGSSVRVTFSNTLDGASSNNPLNPKAVNALTRALNMANNLERINSISISATTNGVHSARSLHYSGRAIDINQVNGVRIAIQGSSPAVIAIQNALSSDPTVTQNKGPHLGTDANHLNHIHFGVEP